MYEEILYNKMILSVVIATLVCQIWKVLHNLCWEKKKDWGVFWATGGMPSSHSTLVVAVTLSAGFAEGWLSTVFLASVGFSALFIRDAIGVRRTVDDLIKNVNEMIKEKKFKVDMIRKIAGHTPIQVTVGILIGAIVTVGIHLLM
ncbi:TPA: divergent PAP2 family protein [Candidatus Woesearchaeota archaeon]|nr:divergent PAP2 family protein [Candidatus Woesearchaeota archaeon]